jgi:hypothetical protein
MAIVDGCGGECGPVEKFGHDIAVGMLIIEAASAPFR